MVIGRDERDAGGAGKCREEQDDESPVDPRLSQPVKESVRRPGAEPAEQTHRRRQGETSRQSGFDNEQRPGKSPQHAQGLPHSHPFADQQPAEHQREKRRGFVERDRVRNRDMGNGVEVGENPGRAERRAQNQIHPLPGLQPETKTGQTGFVTEKNGTGNGAGDQIAEKRLLYGGKRLAAIIRHPHEHGHQRKPQRAEANANYSLFRIFLQTAITPTTTTITKAVVVEIVHADKVCLVFSVSCSTSPPFRNSSTIFLISGIPLPASIVSS